MKKIFIIISLLACCIFFTACQKDFDLFVPDAGQLNNADTTWYSTIGSSMPVAALQNNLLLEPFKDTIELSAANTTSFISSSGLQCSFPPSSFVNSSGTTVTGRAQVELFVIKKKGDMVLMNKPTSSNGNMLVSAGEIFIRLKKDGQDITLAPGAKINIRYVDLPINNTMKLFYGEETPNGNFNWLPNTDTVNTIAYGQQVYEITSNKLRWINLDYFFDTTGITRSTINLKLPSNYTNANTTAFVVFKDMRSVLRINGEANERRFVSGKVPAGKAAWVVVMSRQGNDYFFAKETINTGILPVTVSGVQSLTLTPVKSTLADIKTWLAAL